MGWETDSSPQMRQTLVGSSNTLPQHHHEIEPNTRTGAERRSYPQSMPYPSKRFDTVLQEMPSLQPQTQHYTVHHHSAPGVPDSFPVWRSKVPNPRCWASFRHRSPDVQGHGVLPAVDLLAIKGPAPSPSGPSRKASVLVRISPDRSPASFPMTKIITRSHFQSPRVGPVSRKPARKAGA